MDISKKFITAALFLIAINKGTADNSSSQCQSGCVCMWKRGIWVADCAKMSWKNVPNKLGSDIQSLILTENPLHELWKEDLNSFIKLKNLHLGRCNLSYIHPDAFRNLQKLTVLDLSNNAITTLEPSTFKELFSLVILYLSNNRIEHIHDGLFNNLESLLWLSLKNNKIIKIGSRAFVNLPKLYMLSLNGNKMTTMDVSVVQNLSSTLIMYLGGNPWKCDCELRPLRNLLFDRFPNSPSPICTEPHDLLQRSWKDVDPLHFACKPYIIDLSPTITKILGNDVMLSCKAYGDPPPEVTWLGEDLVAYDGSDDRGDLRYSVSRNGQANTRWANLTIRNVMYDDMGEFTCLAKNPDGSDRKIVKLMISEPSGSWISYVFICGGAIIIIISLFFIVFFWRKKKYSIENLRNPQFNSPSTSSSTHAASDIVTRSSIHSYMSIKTQNTDTTYDHLDFNINNEKVGTEHQQQPLTKNRPLSPIPENDHDQFSVLLDNAFTFNESDDRLFRISELEVEIFGKLSDRHNGYDIPKHPVKVESSTSKQP